MRPGPQHVLRGLAKQLVVLLLALAALMLAGRVEGAGVAAGLVLTLVLVVHVTAFGVSAALKAAPAARLRIAAVIGFILAAAGGVWAASGALFAFTPAQIGGMPISPGGGLMHVAAALTVAGVGGFIFLTVAGRATALGEEG